MTFDFPPPDNADSCSETAEQCPFSEEEWDWKSYGEDSQ